MIHVIILLDTTKLEILELITSNIGCEVLTIKKYCYPLGFTLTNMAIGFSISHTPPTPPCRKVVQYHLSRCYQNFNLQGCFGKPPPSIPSFLPRTSKEQEVDINLNTKDNFLCTLKCILV